MGPLFSATNVLAVYVSHHQADIRSQKNKKGGGRPLLPNTTDICSSNE